MSRRILPLFLLALVALVVASPLLLGWHHRAALQRYKAALRASGQLKTLAEARPQPLTNAANGAPALTKLLALLPELPPALQPVPARGLPPGTRRVTWMEPTLPSDELTNLWPELRSFLGTNAVDLARLRSVLEAPVLEFTVPYEAGVSMALGHLVKIKRTVQFLSADALLRLHDGQSEIALADTLAGIHLVARWNREPLLITQLVRIAIAAIMANSTWEALQFQGWSDADLGALQQAWQELDLTALSDAMFTMEAAEMVDSLERLSTQDLARLSAAMNPSGSGSPDDFIELVKQCFEDPAKGIQALLDRYPRWWAFRMWRRYQIENLVLQQIQAVRGAQRAALATGAWLVPLREAQTNLARLDRLMPPLPGIFLDSSGSAYGTTLKKCAGTEAQRSLVLAAIALERHRLKHGSYPERLAQLIPEFLAAVPRDPMDGLPLRYRRSDDGSFTLYAVGENGRDDGGDPTPTGAALSWQSGKDIVWPKPAALAEGEANRQSRLAPLRAGPAAGIPGTAEEIRQRFLERYEIAAPGPSGTNGPATSPPR